MKKMEKCVTCGGKTLRDGVDRHEQRLGPQVFVAELPATICASCKESYVTSDTLLAFEGGVARHLAQHGPATGESFRFMRKSVGISAKDVAEMLATTPETISRWEKGANGVGVDLWAWSTLAAIVLDELAGKTATRDRLAATRRTKLAKTVAVELGPLRRRA